MQKSYNISPKLDRVLKKNKGFWTRKGLISFATIALAFFLLGIIGKSCWDGYWRTHSWKIQSPVIFQNPLIIEEIKPQTVSPMPSESKKPVQTDLRASKPITEYEQVMKQPHGEALWKIYMLESTRGRADWCRLNGKGFGGFGVIGTEGIACYDTFAKAAERANYWFDKLNPDKNLASALCQYNLGTPNLANCNYYQDYLSL